MGHILRGCFLAAILMLLPCAGCSDDAPLLYCGAGIRPPVAELVKEFQRVHGVRIECDYRGSEVLLGSIKLSGKGDLYMPGDVHYIDQAKQNDLIASSRTVCHFVPVILVAKDNPKKVRSLEDLTRKDVRVGLGDPKACAIGRKSSKIFQKNQIAETDIHVVFRSATVDLLGNHIELGSLDAAIVWDAVAKRVGKKGQIVPIPLKQNVISTVAIGVLKSSTHPEVAKKFVDFVTSKKGREVFRRHHYTIRPPK